MEKWYFKISRADHGTKVDVIRQNRHKYLVSAMCDVLHLSHSTYYYEAKVRENQQAEQELTRQVVQIFKASPRFEDWLFSLK